MTRPVDEFEQADVTLSRALLDHFQDATWLAVDLEMCPRWRWRKRAVLAQRFREACRAADTTKILLGARPGFVSTEQVIKEARQS